MDDEEAIKWLESIDKKYIYGGDEGYDEHRHEAIKTAIKALEENARLKSDIDKLNDLHDDLCEHLAWYINERNRLLAKLREVENENSN